MTIAPAPSEAILPNGKDCSAVSNSDELRNEENDFCVESGNDAHEEMPFKENPRLLARSRIITQD